MPKPDQEKPGQRKELTATKRLQITRTSALRQRLQRRAQITRALVVLAFTSLLMVAAWSWWHGHS